MTKIEIVGCHVEHPDTQGIVVHDDGSVTISGCKILGDGRIVIESDAKSE